MKKILSVLCAVSLLLAFCSCGKDDGSGADKEISTRQTTVEAENVVISVNRDLVADETEFLTALSEIDGITSTADENFYTLTMSQEAYKELLRVKSTEAIAEFDKLSQSEGYIEDITYTADFRDIVVYVNREKFDDANVSAQQLQLITIGAYAMSYQMFLTEGQKTTVSAVYSGTEDVALTVSLPIEM